MWKSRAGSDIPGRATPPYMLNDNDIYAKTAAGLDELRTRARKLPPRLRTLLIMVDGAAGVAQLRTSGAAMGAPANALDELLQLGLIESIWQSPLAPAAAALATSAAQTSAAPADGVSSEPGDPFEVENERFRVARKFMNDTLVDALGLRSFFVTLKLERCFNRADLKAMTPDYLAAITKGSGAEISKAFEERLRQLLN